MSEFSQRVADLSPEKRALLTLQLKKKRAQAAKEQAIPRREDIGAFPLSFAQQRLWFLDQYEPGNPFYNIAAALRLTGPLDVVALQRSFDEIVRRHEVLRATFGTQKGHPVQVIAAELNLASAVVDVQNLPQARREAEALRLATGEAQRSFDLARGPLLRTTLLRLDEQDHLVLVTMHHVVSDGWSMGVLIREIAALYEAFSSSRQSPLPDLPIQYADFAHWQREWLQGELLERQLDYWRGQLGHNPPVLELPTDRPRPAVQTYRGAHHHFALPQALSASLKALSRQEDTTLFVTLLAAFQALLYRYTGQHDVSVGTPVANRNRIETEGLIGFFVNTLVMRANLADDPSFRELLGRVREVALGAYAHQDVPFEMLVDDLQPARSLSHTPLFQVVFALQDALIESLKISGLTLSLPQIESGTSKFDLTLFMEEGEDGLSGILEYNTDLFDAATIERLAGHFQVLLEGVVADPERRISTFPLLADAERRQLLDEWSGVETAYPRDKAIHRLFEAQVERTPDAVAVVFQEDQLTYRELNRQANRLAHHLQGLGVGPEVLVSIFMQRSPEMVIAHLGILKAGGAYLPLDPEYPPERLDFMQQDGRVPVLLTQSQLRDRLSIQQTNKLTNKPTTLCLDTDWQQIATESHENPAQEVRADNLAYVMYTSGSTGWPKGVSVVHRGVVRLVQETNFADLSAQQVFVQLAPISFDAATLEIWGPLLNGGRLVVMPGPTPTLAEIGQALARYRVTTLWLTASLFHLMVDERLEDLAGLRQLLAGGDVLSVAHVRRVTEALDGVKMINGYGPTENTTFSTCYPVLDPGGILKTVPIGYPIANTRVYVLDARLQPVPGGVPGELYVGGDGLARGYLNQPALTVERFVPNPFDDEPGTRLYTTGDVVRFLPDGSIEFLGRGDLQVKVRGFRIELGEIQTVLGQHSAVRDVVVLAREDVPGDKRLVAYVIPEDGALDAGDLRGFLKQKLPEYMVPAVFMSLDAFPVSPAGKVDRQALPAPERTRADLAKAYVAPRTAVEHFLVEKWQDVLGLDRVGIHDNFFELGGDSLQAAVLVNRLQEELETTAHVKALFMAPTVAEMALYMVEYYPQAVAKIDQTESLAGLQFGFENEIAVSSQTERVTEAEIAQIRQLIPPLPPLPEEAKTEPKNPPAIFILSPPRSGSTLFRTMLAGHPRLFAPPELDLMSFNTLGERRAAFSGENSFWLEGPIHAIMDIQGCDVERATRMMEDFESQNLSTKQFYGRLQEWLGARRLVDKTPTYPLDMEILKRMEADFEGALYIHLARHPYATVYSFVEAKLDQLFFRHEHPFSRRVLAELVWTISHQHIREFLRGVPAQRQFNVAFEDLVTQPEAVMKRVCRFLDVEFHPALVRPYDGGRMTEGIRPGTQMVGDFKFYLRKEIDPGAADRWKKFHTVDFLSDVAWQVAESLGYERAPISEAPASPLGIRPIPRDEDLPLSFAQQRLWFLDQLEPDSPMYNIPAGMRLTGALDVAAVEQSLNEIVRRHEALRATFKTVDGKAALAIAPQLTLPLSVVDLTALPQAEREAEAHRQATLEVLRPFNLAQGPLVRAALLQLGPEDHIVLLTMHHIISDGWSVGVLIREMAALYAAFSRRRSSPLPELPVQYVDYAFWQKEWLQSQAEGQLAYWRQALAGLPPVLELPTDHPRPAMQTYRGADHPFTLSRALSDQLKALSRQEGASLFMTLLAAFQTLLYRYTGQDDVSVGTPVANRSRSEIEGLIGFFVNTLVMRANLSGAPTFRELLKRVRQVALGAYAHQDLPFEMLVDEVQPERALSHSPLFQVMFAIQNTALEQVEMSDLTLTPLRVDSGTAKFDLTLFMLEREGTLRGSVEYNTDLFEVETIERMLGHLERLLEGIVADPDQSVARLPLLTDDERRLTLVEWNDTRTGDPLDRCIHHLVEDQASRTPGAVALVSGRQELTYRELDARANQLAHHLRALGVGPGVLVGVCTERSPEMIVGQLGVLKAGAAYVPIDPNYPPERVSFMLQDARVPVLLTQAHLVEHLPISNIQYPISNIQLLRLDADWPTVAQESDARLDNGATARDLAYVLFTSGSTGLPKGVAIEHRNAVALIQWAGHNFSTQDLAGVLVATSNSWDLSIFELFVTLSWGGTVILAENALQLPHLPAAGKVTLINTVPSAIAELLRVDGIPGSVRVVNLAGEPLRATVVDQLYERPFIRRVHDLYGPTEDTTYSTFALRRAAGPEIVGRPINNTQVYVLDANRQPLPVGVSGELYIGGAGVVRGYLNRPELTVEKFVPDPFGDEPGARLYRTGDLVRYRRDGNLEFLGRIDHQVKVRGFRIELGEIETVLREHPGLLKVVVLAREDTPGDKRLVAYVVAGQEPAPGVSELRSHLKTKLPEYMVPAAFVTLEALPLMPNGKVNRRALPAPDQSRPDLEAAFVAPRTQKEEVLAAIWSQVLDIELVGVHDNFFELGGDSILTIQVVTRANQAGLRLSPRQLFQHPTVAGLAAAAVTGAGEATPIQAEQGVVEGPLPLTPIQRWFFEQELPEPHHWNQAVLLEVRQTLDAALLAATVEQLLVHHDALRLRFERVGASNWQQVNAGVEGELPFERVDLAGLPEAEQKTAVETRAAELQASLDLAAGPLLRMTYFDLGPGRPDRLLMVVHHLAIDGVSWRILMEDFQALYYQLDQGLAAQLPPKTTSFRYWAQRLSEYAQTEVVQEQLPYWLSIVQNGAVPLPLDYAWNEGANTEAAASSVRVSLTPQETQALLQDVPAAYGTEINDTLLAALAQVLTRWTGAPVALLDLEGHGREDILDDVDLSRTVGWFTTLYPVALQLAGDEGPGDALRAVKEQLRRVPRRGIGYGLLRYLSQDEDVARKLGALPQPQVVFNYLGQVDQALVGDSPFGLTPESSGPVHSHQGRRSHLLSINGSIAADQLRFEWAFSENLHRRATVERLAEDFVAALRAIILHCQAPDAGGYTPSDFDDVELSQDDIEALLIEVSEAISDH